MAPVSPVARNTLSNFLVQGWSLLLALMTTPYIVRGLGVDAYGVFAALTVLLGYLCFLDLGFGWGLIKFVADYRVRGDRRAMATAVATTLVVFGVVGSAAAIAVFSAAPWIVRRALTVPAELHQPAITALRLAGVIFAVNLIGSVYDGALRGLQRFDLTNAIQAVASTTQIVLAVAAVAAGYGLVGVCLASLGAGVLSTGALYVAVRRSRAFPRSFRPAATMLAALGSFSAYAAASRLGTQTLYQVEKVFIGLVLPVAALGYYMVPFNLAFKVTGIASGFGSAFFPAMSSLCKIGQAREAAALLQRAQRYLVLLLLPPVAFVFAAAPQLLAAWIGADFAEHGSLPLRLLMIAFFLNAVSSLDAIALDAAGRPQATAAQVAVAGGLNMVVGAPLVYGFGANGAAAALLLSMLTLALGLWRQSAAMGLAPRLQPRIEATLGLPVGLVVPIAVTLYWLAPRLTNLPTLLIAAAGFALCCYSVLALFGLDAADRTRARATVEQVLMGLAAIRMARVREDG